MVAAGGGGGGGWAAAEEEFTVGEKMDSAAQNSKGLLAAGRKSLRGRRLWVKPPEGFPLK